jgi:hypothetical protein
MRTSAAGGAALRALAALVRIPSLLAREAESLLDLFPGGARITQGTDLGLDLDPFSGLALSH